MITLKWSEQLADLIISDTRHYFIVISFHRLQLHLYPVKLILWAGLTNDWHNNEALQIIIILFPPLFWGFMCKRRTCAPPPHEPTVR